MKTSVIKEIFVQLEDSCWFITFNQKSNVLIDSMSKNNPKCYK